MKVWDPTDKDIQPRGKQTLDPRGFWYTAVSGIWQTVWIEPELSRGLAAAIYTQTSDVEAEVNGLMTYDRKVIKLPSGMVNV